MMGIDLSETLDISKKLDNIYSSLVEKSLNIRNNMHAALSGSGMPSEVLKGFKDISSAMQGMTSVTSSVTKNMRGIGAIIDGVVTRINQMASADGIEIFDTKSIYTTEELAGNVADKLKEKIEEIKKATEEYNTAVKNYADASALQADYDKKYSDVPSLLSGNAEQLAKDEKQLEIEKQHLDVLAQGDKGLKEYEDTLKRVNDLQDKVNKRKEIEARLETVLAETASASQEANLAKAYKESKRRRVEELNEEKRVLEEKLKYAKMTMDERVAYLIKMLKKEASVEEDRVKGIISQYRSLQTQLDSTLSTKKGYEKIGIGNLDASGKNEYADTLQKEQDLRAKIADMEVKYQEELAITVAQYADKNAKRVLEATKQRLADEKKEWDEFIRTPEGAIMMSDEAKSIKEQREAIELLVKAKENLSNEDADYFKILEELDDRIQKHRISVEQLTKAEKNENTLQPTVRNEYKRLLAELDKVQELKEKIKETDAYKGASGLEEQWNASRDFNAIENREQDLMNRIQQIRNNSLGLLDEVEREHAAKQAAARSNALIAAEEEIKKEREKYATISTADANKVIADSQNASNIVQQKKTIQDLIDARARLDTKDAKYTETVQRLNDEIKRQENAIKEVTDAEAYRNRVRDNYDEASQYAKQAKTMQELKIAIDSLEASYKKLDPNKDSAKMKAAANTIKDLKKRYKELGDQIKDTERTTATSARSMFDSMKRYLNVAIIMNYAKKLAEIRGEFELQQKSLQALTQDFDAANSIFSKTMALAVKSPFSVSELVRYTKQLAAYRIETDKLYETNKMLADISAGLGVEMDRLILAYGQVRAASYLRGTELRQFTEAGIPLLEELSKYFEEVEGKAVSVGEVFSRISKRKVAFEDVAEVLRRVTQEGGAFYQMQEKQAETLKGMMRNLDDSITIMLNDIGIKYEKLMKGVVKGIKKMIDNWRDFAGVVYGLGTGVILSTLVGIGKAASTILSGGWGVAVLAVSGVVAAITTLTNQMSKLNDEIKRVDENTSTSFKQSIDTYRKLAESVKDVTKTEVERKEALNKLKSAYGDILPQMYLERQYIENTADGYRDATDALKDYYNAKNLEQKREAVEQLYSADIDEAIEKLSNYISGEAVNYISGGQENIDLFRSSINGILLAVVSDIENGNIDQSVESVGNAIAERLGTFMGEAFNKDKFIKNIGNAFAGIYPRVNALVRLFVGRENALNNLTPIYYSTADEQKAAKSLDVQKQYISEVEKNFNAIYGLYRNYNKATEKNREQIESSAEKIIKRLPEELSAYKGALTEAMKSMQNAAQEGEFELEEGIRSGITYAFINGLKNIASNTIIEQHGEEAAKNILVSFEKGMEERANEMKFDSFTEAVIDAIDTVVEATNVDKDLFTKFIPKANEKREDLAKRVEEYVKDLKKEFEEYNTSRTAGYEELTGALFDLNEAEKQAKKETITAFEMFLLLLGGKGKNTGGSNARNSLYDERLRVIDDMNKKYKELAKTFDDITSKRRAFEAYKDAFSTAFKDISWIPKNVKQMTAEEFTEKVLNFPDENSLISFLERLAKEPMKAFEKIKVELARGSYELDVETREIEAARKKINDGINRMFEDYELSIDVKELDLPKDIAESVFNVTYTSLDEMKKKIIEYLSEGNDTVKTELEKDVPDWEKIGLTLGDNQKDIAKATLEKIRKMEDDAARDRAKTYVKYLKEEMNERVKLRVETLRKLQEVEESNFSDTQKKRISDNIKNEAKAEEAKLDLKSFQSSEFYTLMFEDLSAVGSNTLKTLNKKLEEMKNNLSDLPVSDVKEIVDQITKLQEELSSRNPFKNLRTAVEDLKSLREKGIDQETAETNFAVYSSFLENTNKEIDIVQSIISARERTYLGAQEAASAQEYLNSLSEDYSEYLSMSSEELNDILEQLKIDKVYQEGLVGVAKTQLAVFTAIVKALKAEKTAFSQIASLANKTLGILEPIGELLGDASGDLQDIMSFASDMGNTGIEMASGINDVIAVTTKLAGEIGAGGASFATSMEAAGGYIGLIIIALKVVVKIISFIRAQEKKHRERELEALTDKVDDLAKKYDKLGKAISSAYDAQKVKELNREMEKNLENQKIAIQRAIAINQMDKDAADPNSEVSKNIKKLKEQLDDLEEQEAERQASYIQKWGGLGDAESRMSFVEDMTQAWLDSFKETGDGLSGLEEQWNEYFDNIALKQLTLRTKKKAMDDYMNLIDKFVSEKSLGDEELTREELDKLNKYKEILFQSYNEEMKKYAELLGIKGGQDTGTLSALAKGVQSITESQAEVIESYLNSIRMFVASSNGEAKEQTKYMRSLFELLNGMTASFGGRAGGVGIKVVTD